MSMLNVKTRLLPIISVLLILGFLLTSLASYFVSRASLRAEIADNELPLTSDTIYVKVHRGGIELNMAWPNSILWV